MNSFIVFLSDLPLGLLTASRIIASTACTGRIAGCVEIHPAKQNVIVGTINKICFMPATLRLSGSGVNAVWGGAIPRSGRVL